MQPLFRKVWTEKSIPILFACIVLLILGIIIWNQNLKVHSVDQSSFIITSLQNGSLVEAGILQYDYRFTTKTLSLTLTSEQKKELRIRLTHKDGVVDYAHVDFLALKIGENEISPDAVTNVNTGEDILHKVFKLDNDVVDVTGQTIEAVWKNVSVGDAFLIMNAREEVLKTLPGVPFRVPKNLDLHNKETFLEYRLKNNGGIFVDGKITAEDNLGKPDYTEYMIAISGHPPGVTYFYIKNDTQYLYVTEDFTGDNTLDKEDWAAVYIFTSVGLKEFGIKNGYGTSGYVYTDTVAYQHTVTEFKIPLSDLFIN